MLGAPIREIPFSKEDDSFVFSASFLPFVLVTHRKSHKRWWLCACRTIRCESVSTGQLHRASCLLIQSMYIFSREGRFLSWKPENSILKSHCFISKTSDLYLNKLNTQIKHIRPYMILKAIYIPSVSFSAEIHIWDLDHLWAFRIL